MRVETVDSELLGGNVLSVDPAESTADHEAQWRGLMHPVLVSTKVPVEDLAAVHAFQKLGFELVETQLRCTVRPRALQGPTLGLELKPLGGAVTLPALQALAAKTFTQDRFTHDEAMPKGFSQARYQRFLARSAESDKERVWGLCRGSDGALVGFKSYRLDGDGKATLLLGAVAPECVGLGFGAINGQLELAKLFEAGVTEAVTHYPVRNYPIINLELRGLGFALTAAFYVLRKVYAPLQRVF